MSTTPQTQLYMLGGIISQCEQALSAEFLKIATEVNSRGWACTPCVKGEKSGLQERWNRTPLTTMSEIIQASKDFGKDGCDVAVVSKRGVNNLCWLDDDSGVAEQIVKETGHNLFGFTLQVQTRPVTAPFKRHFYFTQTQYSLLKLGDRNRNVKDLTKYDAKNIHPTRYDLKGIGGASFVIAAGCERRTGEFYTYENQNIIMPIPRWLVDWLTEDLRKYDAAKATEARERQKTIATEKAAGVPEDERTALIGATDIWAHLTKRAGYLAWNGIPHPAIEICLKEICVTDCENGKQFVTDNPKRIHTIAYKTKVTTPEQVRSRDTKQPRQPKVSTATVGTMLVHTGTLEQFIKIHVKNLKVRALLSTKLYDSLEVAAKSASRPFDRKFSSTRERVSKVMNAAGWTSSQTGQGYEWRR